MIVAAALALTLAAPSGAVCASQASSSASCAPVDDPALRAALAPLLGSIDRPVAPDEWRRLPAGAREYLEALATDPAVRPTRRARAIDGLIALGGDGALQRRLAEDGSAPFLVRHTALRGLGSLLPPDRAAAAILPLLRRDADRRVRATAAEVLVRAAPALGCAEVRAQVVREQERERPAFERALATCGAR